MKILAIDTSSQICSVALCVEDKITTLNKNLPMQQAQFILPMINEVLTQNTITLKQLDALAFGCGPGSFTGLRIATSVVQGIGFAANLPIIPVSSLAALAQATYQDLGWKKLLVAVDARIQEIYWGIYRVDSNEIVSLIGDEIVSQPEAIIFPNEQDWYGVGEAWEIYRSQLHFQPLAIDPTRFPMATGILTLAKSYYDQKKWVTPAEALPVYLRDNVAKKTGNI